MTKLRNIDAVVNAMITNPNATTYDFVAGRDALGDYIEKRSKIASKFRQWRGKHVNATGTDARARHNRDKVVLSNFLVASTIKKFVSAAKVANHPLALFGSKDSAVLLTSHKAAPGTYFKARAVGTNELPSTALAHYEIMVRALESGRRPKLESAASNQAVFSTVAEHWQVRADGDADSNAGSQASELNRLGRGNPPYIWLGNAAREDIDQENESINGDIARGPKVALKAGRNSPPNPDINTALGKTPNHLYAHIYEQAQNISLLKAGQKRETPEQKAQTEGFIAGAYAKLSVTTTEFIGNRFGSIPKEHGQLVEFIQELELAGRQYDQKIKDLRQTIASGENDEVLLEIERTILAQTLNASSLISTIWQTAINDRIRLETAAKPAAAPARRAPPPRPAPPAPIPRVPQAPPPPPLSLNSLPHTIADATVRKPGSDNPFSKLSGSRRLLQLLEQSKKRTGREPGAEALEAVNVLVTRGKATTLQIKAALALFVDEIGDQPEANNPRLTPLNALARNYETRLLPAFLGAKRAIAELNMEIGANLVANTRPAGSLEGDPVVAGKPWKGGFDIHIGEGQMARVPCGVQSDGTFLLHERSGGIARYELSPELAAKGIGLYAYLRELTREVNTVRREFTKGISHALAPVRAIGDSDEYLAAVTANQSEGSYPQEIPASLISTVGDRREEEDRLIASSYDHDLNGASKRELGSVASIGVLRKNTKGEIDRSFALAARLAFYKVVDAKALQLDRPVSDRDLGSGLDITKDDVRKIGNDLAQAYVDELELLRAELDEAEERLKVAELAVVNKRSGDNEKAIYDEQESATYNLNLISAKIRFCTEREAYAIQLSEVPERFWSRTE